MKTRTKRIAGGMALAAGLLAAGISFFSTRSEKIDPTKWGPFPQEYHSGSEHAGREFPLNLNQLLERGREETRKFVKIFPENADPNTWRQLVVYGTAIGNASNPSAETDPNGTPNTWCVNCNAWTREHAYEKISEKVSRTPQTGLVKLLHPPSKSRPAYFEVEEAVPTILVMKNEKGKLYVLNKVATSPDKVATETNNLLSTISSGRTNEVVLTGEDFKHWPVHYETGEGELDDHLAFATAHAQFPQRVELDGYSRDFIVTLDLSDAAQFSFALNTNYSEMLSPKEGRNVLTDIASRARDFGVQAQVKDPALAKKADKVEELLDIRGRSPDTPGYEEKMIAAAQAIFDFSELFIPPYLRPDYDNFITVSREEYLNGNQNLKVISDITSPGLTHQIEGYANESGRSARILRFPTREEIEGIYCASPEEADNIVDSLDRTKAALEFLTANRIEYGSAPRPALERLVRDRPYAVIYTGRKLSDEIAGIERYRENLDLGNSPIESISTLITLAQQIPDRNAVTLLYLPRNTTDLGFGECPDGDSSQFCLGKGGDMQVPSLVVLKNGEFYYTPTQNAASAESAVTEIVKIVEELISQ